jgi:hypothetical protein
MKRSIVFAVLLLAAFLAGRFVAHSGLGDSWLVAGGVIAAAFLIVVLGTRAGLLALLLIPTLSLGACAKPSPVPLSGTAAASAKSETAPKPAKPVKPVVVPLSGNATATGGAH